jgi:hypothetical protein
MSAEPGHRHQDSPRRFRRGVGAALAAGCVAATACGGHTATKQDVIARGNAICAGALRDLRATPYPTSGKTSVANLAAYMDAVLPIVQREVSNLRALPRPATDRPLLDRYVAAVSSSASTYRSLAKAARRGDQAGVNQALATLQANPAATLAGRYGISQCASAGSTAVPR